MQESEDFGISGLRLARSSIFKNRVNVVFHYDDGDSDPDFRESEGNCLEVYFHAKQPDSVVRLFKSSGFRVSESSARFNICFGYPYGMSFYKSMTEGQLISQFPGCNAVAQKAIFCKYLNEASQRNTAFSDLIPRSWVLPNYAADLRISAESRDFYIYKPSKGSEGKGIRVLPGSDVHQLNMVDSAVVQDYCGDVMLLGGRKFDLRLYVLITSIDPLIFYLYDDGLVRIASLPYQTVTEGNCGQRTMHLTNFALNYRDGGEAAKMSFRSFLRLFDESSAAMFGISEAKKRILSSECIVQRIKTAITRTVIALEPRYYLFNYKAGILNTYPRRCFALYGFDVLLKSDGSPLILEVNKCPSKEVKTEADKCVKYKLLSDALNLTGYAVSNDGHDYLSRIPERVDYDLVDVQRMQDKEPDAGDDRRNTFQSYEELCATCKSLRYLNYLEQLAILYFEDEKTRRGAFIPLHPDASEHMAYLFEKKRYFNEVLRWWTTYSQKLQTQLLQALQNE